VKSRQLKLFLWFAVLFAAVVAAYSNHFNNGFHFDDWHTIQVNPAIRTLANLPRFFTDSTTFSIIPTGQTYRPIITASLAVDYALGGGLRPYWFHASTFFWFLVQLVLMYLLSLDVFERVRPSLGNRWLAWLTAAIYGLHPVCAETVNYIIQRADLYSTLGIVAGIVIYARAPRLRRFGLYLLPPLIGMLAKAPGLVFAPILLAYILLIDRGVDPATSLPQSDRKGRSRASGPPRPESIASCIRRALPAFALTVAAAIFQNFMTSGSFYGTRGSAFDYRITQPYVMLRYFRSFFFPLYLTADTDLRAFTTIWSLPALAGFVFLGLLLVAAIRSARFAEWRPVSFGLWWFLIGCAPTSLYPLAEVENDHRMFLPFVGLSIAVVGAGALFLGRFAATAAVQRAAAAACLAVLVAFAFGTYHRNAVWRTDETLWRDVLEKSPDNARGLMAYGNSLFAKGDATSAYQYFQRASSTYPGAVVNLGTAAGALCRDAEAEAYFIRAIRLSPTDPWTHIGYANWLVPRGRTDLAIEAYRAAQSLNPSNLESSYGLMRIYAQRGEWDQLRAVAGRVLELAPSDPMALAYRALCANPAAPVEAAERRVSAQPSAQAYLELSLACRQAHRYDDAIRAARKALELRPDSAEAYMQIAAADEAAGRWDQAAAAAREALRREPFSASALNQLAWSLSRVQCKKSA
jgi:tetratricopeptide (TPR) repeat protein